MEMEHSAFLEVQDKSEDDPGVRSVNGYPLVN